MTMSLQELTHASHSALKVWVILLSPATASLVEKSDCSTGRWSRWYHAVSSRQVNEEKESSAVLWESCRADAIRSVQMIVAGISVNAICKLVHSHWMHVQRLLQPICSLWKIIMLIAIMLYFLQTKCCCIKCKYAVCRFENFYASHMHVSLPLEMSGVHCVSDSKASLGVVMFSASICTKNLVGNQRHWW